MIIALKHNHSIVVGIYPSLKHFAIDNFKFVLTAKRQIKVTSKHFKNYKIKELISTFSYGESYTKEEAIHHYIHNKFLSDIAKYDIMVYTLTDLN